MKSKLLLTLLPVLSVCLTSCGQVKKYEEHLEDYVFTMDYNNNPGSRFNILQLTDIHWNVNTSSAASKIYLEKTIKEADAHIKKTQTLNPNAKIDLVELTGDQFMLATSYQVRTFLNFFEEKAEQYGFKYTIIWGNHDRHGIYNPNWLAKKFTEAKHCIYYEPDDNLYGRSNFIINLVDKETKDVRWQIANLDSGASFSETAISPFRDYDYIRKDQTDWWVKEHALVGEEVPAIAYYHIPQDENPKAYEAREGLENRFFKLEGFGDNGTEEYQSDFIDEASKHNLKAAFMGHAHNIDWTVRYREEDWELGREVVLGLGVKTGPELYFAHIDVKDGDEMMKEGLASLEGHVEDGLALDENFDLIGASLVSLKDSILGTFDLEHLYLNERESGDFVRWVKW